MLATIAATHLASPGMAAPSDPVSLTGGIAAAYQTAAGLALAGTLLALTVLRRGDVAAGAHHPHGLH